MHTSSWVKFFLLQIKSVFDCQSPNKFEIVLWDIYPNMDHMSAVIPWDNIIIDGRSYYLEWTGDISDNSIYELSLMIYNIKFLWNNGLESSYDKY